MITRVLLGATRRRDILLCFHPAFPLQLSPFLLLISLSSRLHQSRPVLNTASTNVRLFSYFCPFFISFSFFHRRYRRRTNLFLFFTNRTCIVHRESGDEIKAEGDLCEKGESRNLWAFLYAYQPLCRDLYNV